MMCWLLDSADKCNEFACLVVLLVGGELYDLRAQLSNDSVAIKKRRNLFQKDRKDMESY